MPANSVERQSPPHREDFDQVVAAKFLAAVEAGVIHEAPPDPTSWFEMTGRSRRRYR
jgi:hypothetical protein